MDHSVNLNHQELGIPCQSSDGNQWMSRGPQRELGWTYVAWSSHNETVNSKHSHVLLCSSCVQSIMSIK